MRDGSHVLIKLVIIERKLRISIFFYLLRPVHAHAIDWTCFMAYILFQSETVFGQVDLA
jgi:hypothetical protein